MHNRTYRMYRATTHRVSNVVHYDGGLCSPVVHWGQTVVSLLSCSVPDLKLDCRIIQVHSLSQEGSWSQQKRGGGREGGRGGRKGGREGGREGEGEKGREGGEGGRGSVYTYSKTLVQLL